MSADRIKKILSGLPTHVVIIGLCLVWFIPTLGLLVTSLRPFQDINSTGWWMILAPPKGAAEYSQSCAACHGADGKKLPNANLANPELVQKYPRSIQLLAMLHDDINGQPHMKDTPIPKDQQAADIAAYLRQLSGVEARPR